MSHPVGSLEGEVIRALSLEGKTVRDVDPNDPDSVISAIRFFSKMAEDLEQHGNHPESVKSAESALLLRRAHADRIASRLQSLIAEGVVPRSSVEEAAELVLRCNSYAVAAFNERHFDAAEFFLGKALFLTDLRKAHEANYFPDAEARRLRMRAATLNNLGCMEKRRGRLEQSLAYFRQSVELEVSIDDHSRVSPSTQLNLCNVLNELRRHSEAVRAAESAIATLECELLEQRRDRVVDFAMMLVVGLYNLGVSLERRGREGDASKAHNAYNRSLQASRKYLVDPNCPTVEMAMASIRRMRTGKMPYPLPEETTTTTATTTDVAAGMNVGSGMQRKIVDVRSRDCSSGHASGAASVAAPAATGAAAGMSLLSNEESSQTVAPLEQAAPSAQQGQQMSSGLWAHSVLPMPFASQAGSDDTRERRPERQLPRSAPASTFSLTSSDRANPGADSQHAAPQIQTTGGISSHPQPTREMQGVPTEPHPHVDKPTMQLFSVERKPSTEESHPIAPTGLPLVVARSGSVSGLQETSLPFAPSSLIGRQPLSGSGSLTLFTGGAQQLAVPSTVISRPNLPPLTESQVPKPPQSTPLRLPPSRFPASTGASSTQSIPQTLTPLPRQSRQGSIGGIAFGGVGALATLGASKRVSLSKGGGLSISEADNPFGRRTFGGSTTRERSSSQSLRQLAGMSSTASMALEKHVQRTQTRQSTMKESKKKADGRRTSAIAKAKEREMRMQAKEEAKRDAEMADTLYNKLVYGMRAEELLRCNRAATLIQRIWRGCLARTLVIRMVSAARRIQKAVRVYLVKVLATRRAEEERLAREKLAREKRELEAVQMLQIRVRQFLRRVDIRRQYISRKMRRHYAARSIQRAYRAFLQRRSVLLTALMEQQRLEDERQRQLAANAACHIQWAFRRYLRRREELKEAQEVQRRHRAAASIQALIRGVLARAWFSYYKSYRREEEFKSAANQKRVTMLQSAARVQLAVRVRRDREVALVRHLHKTKLNRAARKIQCLWRCRVAWITAERRRAERGVRVKRVERIQGWYLMCVLRRKFLKYRKEKKKLQAAVAIQRWYRNSVIKAKEREFSRYHAKEIRQQKRNWLQSQSLLLLQAWGRCFMSTLIVRSMRSSFLRFTLYAEGFQRLGRGYMDRLALTRLKYRLISEASERVQQRRRAAAACVIQRAWRCCMAKSTVEQLRRCAAASTFISKNYRGYCCRKELHRLREAKELRKEIAAVKIMQRTVRQFLWRIKLVRLDAYYRERQRKKLLRMRRDEAATTLQAVWRGRATRLALEHDGKDLKALSEHAVRIQRAWRARQFRRKINMEVAQRTTTREERYRAVLRIQCFWRKATAAEFVARLREETAIRSKMAIEIQTRWRCILAKRELELLRAQRREERDLEIFYMEKWESLITMINATLRVRLAQHKLLERRRRQLLMQLTDAERERFLRRHGAATKIQALYRGFYERVYARGLRRQREEEERRRKEREVLERHSAIKVQCAFRCWCARRKATALRTEERTRLLEAEIEHHTTVNPQDLVKQLFWAHETVAKRDFTKERVERAQRRERAALLIQTAVRRWLVIMRTRKVRLQSHQTQSARTIQNYWTQYRARKLQKELERQRQAAIIIQARVRGYFVRREWEEWRRRMAFDRQHQVLEEDVYDRAATVLQSFWRRIRAERVAERLREERDKRKVEEMLDEAARFIQRVYRRHLSRRREKEQSK